MSRTLQNATSRAAISFRSEKRRRQLKALARVACSDTEIAAFFGVGLRALSGALERDPDARAIIDRERAKARYRVRKTQFAILHGSPDPGSQTRMAIHLGRVLCDQQTRAPRKDEAETHATRSVSELIKSLIDTPKLAPDVHDAASRAFVED